MGRRLQRAMLVTTGRGGQRARGMRLLGYRFALGGVKMFDARAFLQIKGDGWTVLEDTLQFFRLTHLRYTVR